MYSAIHLIVALFFASVKPKYTLGFNNMFKLSPHTSSSLSHCVSSQYTSMLSRLTFCYSYNTFASLLSGSGSSSSSKTARLAFPTNENNNDAYSTPQQHQQQQQQQQQQPRATIVGYISNEEEEQLKHFLVDAGFVYISSLEKDKIIGGIDDNIYSYKYIKASGMLKLVESINLDANNGGNSAPKWIPVQSGEENVLVANGWSFLDPDESEPMSAFDIDAANEEGQYVPKWGSNEISSDTSVDRDLLLSSLGFDIKPMLREEVLNDVDTFLKTSPRGEFSRSALLDGATDEPNVKITNNGYDFSGSVRDIQKGMFVCAIGGLPLFTSADLSPTTASSGWLTFARPVAFDHIKLVHAKKGANDQRTEVICGRSGCHLGHYFGTGEGYCINTSALNFIPIDMPTQVGWNTRTTPISWLKLAVEELSPAQTIVRDAILNNISLMKIALGAGCFWHVEFALRRLPGMVDTSVGYSGGITSSPTYKDVCDGRTNHAEVVMCSFDPQVLNPRLLLDCFLAMHDPTIVRAHGKRAQKSGQYRSCIFVYDENNLSLAQLTLKDCTKQMGKFLSTEVRHLSETSFWTAESRHQRHDERVKNKDENDKKTLGFQQWLLEYGRRSASIWGSSETIMLDSDDDDGMARLLI